MTKSEGLICAFHVDAGGKAEPLEWKGIESALPKSGWRWVHLDRRAERARKWLHMKAGLDGHIADALLSAETRPRCEALKNGLLLFLRGVNLNPDALPEDMVSIRIWIEPGRIITCRSRKLLAVQDIRDAYGRGEGPESIGDLLIDLADGLISRMGRVIAELDDEVDTLEESSQEAAVSESRTQLLQLRRRAILLRRYLAPQREALSQLAAARTNIIEETHRPALREAVDHVFRLVEELDALRERAAVVQDEIATRLAEQMNTAMYRLSVVATIFLPLSLFTGLLGINVGGIPGTDVGWAFWAVCGLLAVMTGITIWLIRIQGKS